VTEVNSYAGQNVLCIYPQKSHGLLGIESSFLDHAMCSPVTVLAELSQHSSYAKAEYMKSI
jgi:hypothetical protein